MDGKENTVLAKCELTEDQIDAGFVCTCQCYVTGPGVVVQLGTYDKVCGDWGSELDGIELTSGYILTQHTYGTWHRSTTATIKVLYSVYTTATIEYQEIDNICHRLLR